MSDVGSAGSVAELSRRVRVRRSALDRMAGEAQMLLARRQELTAAIAEHAANRERAERVSGVLSKIASDRDEEARKTVEDLVSAGLSAIFEENLTFHVTESMSRGAPQIEFTIRTHLPNGVTYDTDVLSARGGGVASVVGLLLRVALIVLTRSSQKREPEILVLDETLAMLSREYLESAAQFLRTVADQTGIQIVVVTHQPELEEQADVVYRFHLSNGVTVASRKR